MRVWTMFLAYMLSVTVMPLCCVHPHNTECDGVHLSARVLMLGKHGEGSCKPCTSSLPMACAQDVTEENTCSY